MSSQPAIPRRSVTAGRHLLASLLICAAVLAAYLPPLLDGRVYYSEDTTDLNSVMLRSHVDDLENHGFVAWLPSIGTGHYRAADPTYSIYSPRLLVFRLIPDYDAQLITVIAYALWAGLGAYALGLALTSSWPAALYMGILWPLAGVLVSRVSNIPYFTSAAWLPWALAAWSGVSRPGRRALLTALAAAMVGVDGDLFGMACLWAVLALLTPFLRPAAWRRDLPLLGIVAALGAGLTAVIWAPALSVLPDSVRALGLDYASSTDFSLHPARLINLFAPRLFGDPMEGSFWGNRLTSSVEGHAFWFSSIYLGILAPLLAAAALWRRHERRRAAAGLLMIGAVFALFAFGRYAPFWAAARLLPGAGAFRYPAKLFTISALCLMGAAGIGMGELPAPAGEAPARRRCLLYAALLYAAALVLALSMAAHDADLIRAVSPRPGLSFLRIEQDLGRIAAAAVIFPALAWLVGRRFSRPALPLILTALTAADLLSALPGFQLNPRFDFYQPSLLAREIRERGPGRIIVDSDLFTVLHVGPRSALKPDWAVLEGVEYGMGRSATMNDLVSGLDNSRSLREDTASLMRILAIKYVVGAEKPRLEWMAAAQNAGLIRPVVTWDKQNMVLYEAVAAFPEAGLTRDIAPAAGRRQALALALEQNRAGPAPVFIPAGAAIVRGRLAAPGVNWAALHKRLTDASGDAGRVTAEDRPDGDRLILDVEARTAAMLVVREYLMPGWHCRVDGAEVPIFFADGIGRAVALEPGTHHVLFTFTPPRLPASAIVSSLFLVLTVIGLARPFGRKGGGRAGPGA